MDSGLSLVHASVVWRDVLQRNIFHTFQYIIFGAMLVPFENVASRPAMVFMSNDAVYCVFWWWCRNFTNTYKCHFLLLLLRRVGFVISWTQRLCCSGMTIFQPWGYCDSVYWHRNRFFLIVDSECVRLRFDSLNGPAFLRLQFILKGYRHFIRCVGLVSQRQFIYKTPSG